MADAYKIGAFGTDTLTARTVRILTRVYQNMAAATGYCFFVDNAVNYQVPANRTLHITGFILTGINNDVLANPDAVIRYADDAALTTNPVALMMLPYSAAAIPIVFPVGDLQVPTGHYVGVYNTTANNDVNIVVFGYEEVV